MISHRNVLARTVGLASLAVFALSAPAAAQFPPPPGQSGPVESSPFPPPPGQSAQQSASPFPDPPGQSRATPSSASPFPPAGGAPRSSAPTGPSPFPTPGTGPQGDNPCNAFVGLRQRAEDGAKAIQAAGERKAAREEVCPLFQRFATAESQMVKFLEENQKQCGVPLEAIKDARGQHAQTIKIRNQVCAAPPRPPGPSLSDAFGTQPIAPPEESRRGYGIFDTLTGNALSR